MNGRSIRSQFNVINSVKNFKKGEGPLNTEKDEDHNLFGKMVVNGKTVTLYHQPVSDEMFCGVLEMIFLKHFLIHHPNALH
jgi:hypothetical protein